MSDTSVHNGNIITNCNFIININNNDDVNHGEQLLNNPGCGHRCCRRIHKRICGNKGRNPGRNHLN